MESCPVDPMLCCMHRNTFFEIPSNTTCPHNFMFTMHITYFQRMPSGQGYNYVPGVKGVVERTVCMPFESMDGLKFETQNNELVVIDKTGKVAKFTARDLHVIEDVIENMDSVAAYGILDMSHIEESAREGKR